MILFLCGIEKNCGFYNRAILCPEVLYKKLQQIIKLNVSDGNWILREAFPVWDVFAYNAFWDLHQLLKKYICAGVYQTVWKLTLLGTFWGRI